MAIIQSVKKNKDVTAVAYHNNIYDKKCCLIIRHALGAIDGHSYTNSIEAFDTHLNTGSLVFEADFSKTKDGHWVLTHDWSSWQKMTKYDGSLPPTLQQFNSQPLRIKNDTYHAATIADLENAIRKDPNILIVTDTKNNFIEMLPALMNSKIKSNLIWQAYNFSDIDLLLAHKQERIILTLYKLGKTDLANIVKVVNAKYATNLMGVTIPLEVYEKTPGLFKKLQVPIYLHGSDIINSRHTHQKFKNEVSGFYLDNINN